MAEGSGPGRVALSRVEPIALQHPCRYSAIVVYRVFGFYEGGQPMAETEYTVQLMDGCREILCAIVGELFYDHSALLLPGESRSAQDPCITRG